MKRRDFLKLPALAAIPMLPALPAAAPAVNAGAAEVCGQTAIVHLGGEVFSAEQMRQLAEMMTAGWISMKDARQEAGLLGVEIE